MVKRNDRWSQLSMKQRADLIKLYTDSGITSLSKIREDYNSFGAGGDTKNISEAQLPTTNIVTKDNYLQKLEEFNVYRQNAKSAADSHKWDAVEDYLDKADSLGKEIAKYTLNENEKYVGSALNYGYWAGTRAVKEPEDIEYLLRRNIREDGKDVAEWLKSYVNSEGFDRTVGNQESWWKSIHPYQKLIYPISKGWDNKAKLNQYVKTINEGADKMLNYVLDGQPNFSFTLPYKGATFTYKPKIKESKELPFNFVQMHEFDHLFNDIASNIHTINAEAMSRNTNTEKGHDSKLDEKHSDILGLKYLLFKEGIYDASGSADITPEQVEELRKRYPELRPLIQMDNEKAAWMINHVAQNTTNENRLDYVNSDNIVAFGGKLLTKRK